LGDVEGDLARLDIDRTQKFFEGLARDDQIAVAGTVLAGSNRLTTGTLVEIARLVVGFLVEVGFSVSLSVGLVGFVKLRRGGSGGRIEPGAPQSFVRTRRRLRWRRLRWSRLRWSRLH